MWRGGLGSAYLLPALSAAGASLSGHAPFPHPAHRIGRACFSIRLSEKTQQQPEPLHVTLSATSENKSGVARLIAILPFCRRFLRLPSTEAPSSTGLPGFVVLRASPHPVSPAFLSRVAS